MSFDPALIYRRTPAGVSEVYQPRLPLAPEARLVLRLIDGRIANAGLATRLPAVGAGRVGHWLRELQRAGLLEPVGQALAADLPQAGEGGSANAALHGVVAALERAVVVETPGAPSSRVGAAESPRRRDAGPATQQAAVVTQFAITSVNVPDALDLQEERDRAEWAEALARKRSARWRRWGLRGGIVASVVLVAGLALGWWRPMPESLGAPVLGRQLSSAMGAPVTVGASTIEFAPGPRLVLTGVQLGDGAKVARVVLAVGWGDLWRGLVEGQWSWGEASVSALVVSPTQALELAHMLLARGEYLPERIATLRFDTVRIADSSLLAGDYEVVARRTVDGRFGRLVARRLDLGQGRWEATVSGATPGAPLVFELEASELNLPFGPALRWKELRASGTVSSDRVRVSHFALAGYQGVVTGWLVARKGDDWSLAGQAELANLDIEALLAGRRAASPNAGVQGSLSARLDIEAQGATLPAAVAATRMSGDFQVRWAVLRGVNLGAFAVQSAGAAGGATRFTEFDGRVLADRFGTRLVGAGGRAGAMTARGDVQIAPGGALRGQVRVELGGLAARAPIALVVGGDVQQLQFQAIEN